MDPMSLAAAMVGAQMSQMQMAAAAFMMGTNSDAAVSVVQIIDAAQQNIQSLANVVAGA